MGPVLRPAPDALTAAVAVHSRGAVGSTRAISAGVAAAAADAAAAAATVAAIAVATSAAVPTAAAAAIEAVDRDGCRHAHDEHARPPTRIDPTARLGQRI